MPKLAVGFRLSDTILAGIIGGVVFAVFEMIAAALLMGPAAFVMPLRMIGAIVLGEAALDPGYSLAVAGMAGVVVHMVLSVGFALVFAAGASPLDTMRALMLAGIAFGILLWLVNFYVVAPIAGWTWFPERSNVVVQFLAHAFFYGFPLGWYLAKSRVAAVRPI